VKARIHPTIALAMLSLLWAFSHQAAAQPCPGNPGEDPAACKREQAAARKAEQRGELQSGINFRENALRRCDPLTGSDRDDCVRRVQGEGKTTGSVESGGIYRETHTITIGPQPGGGTDSGASSGTSR
jgi:hypothetical protein